MCLDYVKKIVSYSTNSTFVSTSVNQSENFTEILINLPTWLLFLQMILLSFHLRPCQCIYVQYIRYYLQVFHSHLPSHSLKFHQPAQSRFQQ